MPILTTTSGLFDILEVYFLDRPGDRLAVGYARRTDIGLHAELAQQAIHNNIKVQFSHTGNNGLAGVFIRTNTKCGIFLSEFAQSLTHLILIGRTLRFNGDRDNRFRESNALQHQSLVIAKSIPCEGIFEAQHRANVAGADFSHILTVVRMHTDQTADALFLALGRVLHRLTLSHDAGVNTEIRQSPNIWISHNLKYQGA